MLLPALARPWRTVIADVDMRDWTFFFACVVIWPGTGGVFRTGPSTGQKARKGRPPAAGGGLEAGYEVLQAETVLASKTRGSAPHVSYVRRSKREGRAVRKRFDARAMQSRCISHAIAQRGDQVVGGGGGGGGCIPRYGGVGF